MMLPTRCQCVQQALQRQCQRSRQGRQVTQSTPAAAPSQPKVQVIALACQRPFTRRILFRCWDNTT